MNTILLNLNAASIAIFYILKPVHFLSFTQPHYTQLFSHFHCPYPPPLRASVVLSMFGVEIILKKYLENSTMAGSDIAKFVLLEIGEASVGIFLVV